VKLPELLAPASGPEEFRAALAGGADAVYLGLKRFNARQRARNFTLDELEKAVQDARRAGARIYLTFNTLLFDGEWHRAERLLAAAWERGVDALIVQDWGVIEWVRRNLPGFPMHASTQMTVHDPSQLAPLAESGVERVILARELSLGEVATMAGRAAELGLGTEVFVHGALCVAYSGQCLMSSLLEGRSGNRGLCAQLCRRSFTRQARGRASRPGLPLSMKDLSALSLIPELVRLGVKSLKVEGRLKRPEYVTEVVSVYREALDRLEKGGGGSDTGDLLERLEQVFNRGFGTGGLEGPFRLAETTGRRGGPRFPHIGTVSRIDRRRLRILARLKREPAAGDGLALFPIQGGAPTALVVTRLFEPGQTGRWIGVKTFDGSGLGGCPERGELYLTSSAADLRRIREAAVRFELPRIGLRLTATGVAGEPFCLRAETKSGLSAEARSATPLAPAARKALDEEVLASQLGRMGGTAFFLEELRCRIGADLFLPVSELNGLRRSVVDELEAQRTARRPLPEAFADRKGEAGVFKRTILQRHPDHPGTGVKGDDTAARRSGRRTEIAVLCRWNGIEAAAEAGADHVYCDAEEILGKPDGENVPFDRKAAVGSDAKAGAPSLSDAGDISEVRPWLRVPAITPAGFLESVSQWLEGRADSLEGILAGHGGALSLARKFGLVAWADTSFNLMNSLACAGASRLGAAGVTLSWELGPRRAAELAKICPLPAEIVILGRPPLMHTSLQGLADPRSAACLEDEAGRRFPLIQWNRGRGVTVAAHALRDWSAQVRLLAGRAARLRLDLREIPEPSWPDLVRIVRALLAGEKIAADPETIIREILPSHLNFL